MTASTSSTDNIHSVSHRFDDAVRPSHALQGASLAFSSPSTSVASSPKKYSGANGALAAASFAGSRTTPTGSAGHGQLQDLGSSRLRRSYGHPMESRAQRSSPTHVQQVPRRAFSGPSGNESILKAMPADGGVREQSPSHIAAIVAASKATPRRDADPQLALRSNPRRPSPLARQDDYSTTNTPMGFDASHPTDDTPITATNALVKLYESIQSPPGGPPGVGRSNDGPPIISPRPVRPSSARQLSITDSILLREPQDITQKERGAKPAVKNVSSLGAAAAATKLAKPPVPKRQSTKVAKPAAPRVPQPRKTSPLLTKGRPLPAPSLTKTPSESSSSSYASAVDKLTSPKREILALRLHDGSNDLHGGVVPLHTQRAGPYPSMPEASSSNEQSPARPVYNKASRSFEGPVYGSVYSPARRPTLSSTSLAPQLTADSLANAMVASSLASSRAPSPNKPHLPPPRRHGKPHSLFHRSHSTDEVSRTPSPAKQMRQTLRTSRKSEEEEQGYKAKRSHFMKKHPNKHHEGDRKRWRDTVSEVERKRYEGVWAANKNLLHAPEAEVILSNTVLDIVVRDIWRRSRLPDDVLEEIWNLVDTTGQQALGKEEFVVGMWLIDQRLKGRKLPVRVSESVWGSVRMLSGIKVPKHRK